MDPEYNVLWAFSPSSGEVSCFNPIAADIEGKCDAVEGCKYHEKE